MNHKPTPKHTASPFKPIGDHIDGMLQDTRKNVLRQMLAHKSKEELIDALFEIVYLSDLLGFFTDDIDHFLATS